MMVTVTNDTDLTIKSNFWMRRTSASGNIVTTGQRQGKRGQTRMALTQAKTIVIAGRSALPARPALGRPALERSEAISLA